MSRYVEAEHPRDHGKWTNKAGAASKASLGGAISRLVASTSRAWSGEPKETKERLGKSETGAIAEAIAMRVLTMRGIPNVRQMGLTKSEKAVDVLGDHQVFEVKGGVTYSTTTRWRLTIGEPGEKEKAWLAKASPEKKRAWNERKYAEIERRKMDKLRQVAKEAKAKISATTVGVLINPDTKTADVYIFKGFHRNVGWNSDLAKKSYVGSYRYG